MSAYLPLSQPVQPSPDLPSVLTASANSNRRMLCLVIGQASWEDILHMLPDSFFGLDEAAQEKIWGRMVHAAIRGQTDPEVLLKIGLANG